MIGAIIGDVVGSRFEFNNIKTKDFTLVTDSSEFTDDTVMTVAVMDAVMQIKEKKCISAANLLQKWARKYPYAGYGSVFSHWIYEENPQPYNSCGNGSAMRVSAVGYAAESEEEVKFLSDAVTKVTHNHREGMKGAYVTAMLIYMARKGATKEEMKAFASKYYDINFSYDELVKTYVHGREICQNTVPQAVFCFLISNSFEDCLRTTISIGGDCDTTAAISCAIAEAFYKEIPETLIKEVRAKLDQDMLDVIESFKAKYGGK